MGHHVSTDNGRRKTKELSQVELASGVHEGSRPEFLSEIY